ncbi:MAG TPA: phosphate regulon sensor histidine kinase PhoR [Rhizobiales bacterium]|nr:phosphate regulon sensor histidine kinase PhoR [Hyphomicrobiales bacterium]
MTAWLRRRGIHLLTGLAGFVMVLVLSGSVPAAVAAGIIALLPAFLGDRRTEPPPPRAADPSESADPLANVKAAFAGFDSPVFLLDRQGNVLFQNHSAAHAFGEINAGQHVSARIRQPAVLDIIRESFASGKPGATEIAMPVPSESVYLVRVVKAEGEADFFVLIFRDISETRRIDRMRTDFVANASHELRTPLASLRGFIETLMGPARNDPRAQEKFLAIMQEQVTRMSRLVDDLMSLSRLELKAKLAPDDAVDLVPLIGSVCDALAPLADHVGVEIVRNVPEGPVIVRGDRDELTQVFENLIENACKYGQEGKTVEVTLSAPDGQPPEVSVRDHGPGIPEEHVPRLTERFYRVNVESSRSKKGTGLGLAIVKHILTRHRARLVIRSEVGKGSTFTVRF